MSVPTTTDDAARAEHSYSRSYVKPLKNATPALVGLDRALQFRTGRVSLRLVSKYFR